MKQKPTVQHYCSLHPQEKIIDELCIQCTALEWEDFEKLKSGHRFSVREKAIWIRDISLSLVPQVIQRLLIDMLLMERPRKRCIECATPLNVNGYCDDCTKHWEKVDLQKIKDFDKIQELYEEILDADIPEKLKIDFMNKYEKFVCLEETSSNLCPYCSSKLEKGRCPSCLKLASNFWEKYVWSDLTATMAKVAVRFIRLAKIPNELKCDLLTRALGIPFNQQDLQPKKFWPKVEARIKLIPPQK